jgi:adenosylhomocysteinase
VDRRPARPDVEEFRLADGRRLLVIAAGRLVNLGAAEGHPAAVMDMSFANQALWLEWLAGQAGVLDRKVYPVPRDIDREIARLKLESMGISIDRLTEAQQAYLSSWTLGT